MVVEYPNLSLLIPEIVVLLTGFALFTLDLTYRRLSHWVALWLSFVGYLIAFLYLLFNISATGSTFYGLYVRDPMSSMFQLVMVGLTMIVLPFAQQYLKHRGSLYREFYYFLAFALAGGMFLVSSYNLVVLYVALEAVSISFYVMTALLKGDFLSKEGAFKYLVLGGLSIALASYGAAFLYLYGGSLDLREVLALHYKDTRLLVAGLVLLLMGFAIKIGAVPFHFWLPDAYHGAPTPVTAYMASVGKLAFFAPVVRIMPLVQEHFANTWVITVSIISVLTMLYGNLVALVQRDVKRMLAYSSIAHSGYIMAGIAVAQVIGLKAVLYFLVAYAFMGVAGFLVLAVLERSQDWRGYLEEFSGVRFHIPWLAFAFMLVLLALLGVPPTVGFVGKALVFLSLSYEKLWWVAFVMIVATGISTGYYLRLIALMFMKEPVKDVEFQITPVEKVLLVFLSVLVVLLGAVPIFLWSLVSPSAEILFKR